MNKKERSKYASELGKKSWKKRKTDAKALAHLRAIASKGGKNRWKKRMGQTSRSSTMRILWRVLPGRPRPHSFSLLDPMKESGRFDEENCDILCVKDHQWFEEHKTEYREWKRKRMGEQPFNLLMVRAHTPGKKDDTPILIWLKQEMKKQKI